MKKIILSVLLICIGFTSVLAQQGRQAQQRIEAQKVAYITKKLELTPSEAEVFWPIYNQFHKERKAINQKYKRKKQLVNMTDEEVEQHLLGSFEKDQELLDLRKEFYKEMKVKFSARKMAMLYVAEKEFKATILDKWKQSRKERRQRRMRDRQ